MRRLVDLVIASFVLMIFSPLMVVAALAIIVSSPGHPFYRGWRVGKNGKNFRMWKFRTMVNGAAKMGCITGPNDPRVTPIGRLLRKAKLDELPQVINLFRGDMTLIGPRPESPEIVALYTPAQRAVLAVKPGITGKVQVEYVHESEMIPDGIDPQEYYIQHLMDRKLRLDLDYLARRTFFTDARIVFATAALAVRSFAQK